MKQLVCLVVFTAVIAGASPVRADVPHLVRYQGQAVDTQGVPLEGPYNLTFRLYDAETAGTVIWQETQAGVVLAGGHFSVLLGSVTSLASVDWTQPQWLGVQVNGEPELAPRQRITSVPLAITAERLAVPVTTSTITDDANALVPSGAVILWTGASCPAGYARLSVLDDRFVVGGASYNTSAGGSTTHDHGGQTGDHALSVAEMPPHTHGLRGHSSAGGPGPNWFPNQADPVFTQTESAGSGQAHSHPITAADHRPPFATVLLCQRN